MKKSLYIYHHLGLGDHIVFNALVRYYATLYKDVYVFCKPHNIFNVRYMYRDNKNIHLIPANNKEAESYLSNSKKLNYLWLRFDKKPDMQFDIAFYYMAGLPFEYKWNKFYLKRDKRKEKQLYYNFKLNNNGKYIFVHDDKKRNFGITKGIPENIKIIRPDISLKGIVTIFEYLYIIEKAEQVHCIDSAFFNLIDCMQLRNKGLFFHRYVRIGISKQEGTPKHKMNWKIIN